MNHPTNNWWRRLRFLLKKWFKPIPINRPKVDPEFMEMGGLARAAHSVSYSILSLEYWISASGRLRCWMRNNVLLATLLAIPALIIMPLLGLMLWQVVCWVAMLVSLAGSLALIPILAVAVVLSVVFLINLIKSLFRFK